MRILVTGHEGYIGSVLVPRLKDAGHDVIGLDTGYFATGTLGPVPDPIPSLRTDLRDVTTADIAEAAPDAVVHLAALCNDPLGDLDPDLTYDVNHRSTVRLATAAKAAGVPRFLFSSSCSLYGSGTEEAPLDEDAPFAPLTPYGESKILSERDLAPLADDDFSPVSFATRPRTVSRRACAATWSSTTSSATRCSPARSGCAATAWPGVPSFTSRTSAPRSRPCLRYPASGYMLERSMSVRRLRTT
jgi:hypothetical protein